MTRPHDDLEIAVLRHHQHQLWSHFKAWSLEKIVDRKREPWTGETLSMPVHELHGRSVDSEFQMEFLLNESADNRWVYRRDASISLPLRRAFLQSSSGVPVLAPEIAILFKSKSPRGKDEMDFAAVLPQLDRAQMQWLREALVHGHASRWLEILKKTLRE